MENLPVNVVDIIVGLVLLVSAILAYFRGFVHETLSIGGWVGAILITIYGLPHAQPYARQFIEKEVFADVAAGTVLFIVSLFVLSILTAAVSTRIRESALGALDKALGFLFGIARGAVLVCLVYLGVVWIWPDPKEQPELLLTARTQPLMAVGGDMLKALVPEGAMESQDLDKYARETKKFLDSQDTLRDMLDVKPKGKDTGQAGPETGYDPRERRDMERLLETTK